MAQPKHVELLVQLRIVQASKATIINKRKELRKKLARLSEREVRLAAEYKAAIADDDTPLGQDDQSWRDLTDADIEAIRNA